MNDPVLDLISKKSLQYKVSGQDYLIKCLSPKHEDSNPSLRVDKITGIMNCFACGFKGNIFSHFNVFSNYTSIKIAKLKEKMASIKVDKSGLELPPGATPFNRAYRGIRAETYKTFGAFYTNSVEELMDRLCIPIKNISDNTVVFVARHTLSEGNPKYINYPAHSEMPVFPPLTSTGSKSIVLVEGIFDFLNLYDKGLKNAVCCFGVTSLFKNISSKLLAFKVQGVRKVFILFDGDKPGRDNAIKLQEPLENLGFEVEILNLEDGVDPGVLDQDQVTEIKSYIDEKSSHY